MANPLYAQLTQRAPVSMPGDIGNIMQQVDQLAATFRGDPRATVQQLLNSGQMTQAQFNQLSQMANQIMRKAGR